MQSIGVLRAQLYNAIFGQDSIISGDLIYDLLAQLENRSDEMLPEDLDACRDLVDRWFGMWFPTANDS